MKKGDLLPSSRNCFICGVENPVGLKMKFYLVEPGVVEAQYSAPAHFEGYPGVLHGGIIASILDETSGRAFGPMQEEPRFMFTAKLEVTYRKNVPVEKPLRIVGKAVKDKGRSAQGWAGIYDAASGELLAEGSNVLVNIQQEKIAAILKDHDTGWQVYPDED